ncbi:hypothetical protein [Sulfuricurvum sp.]|nr:hypothetical protein [Sulfuricurvum sp.]
MATLPSGFGRGHPFSKLSDIYELDFIDTLMAFRIDKGCTNLKK